MSPGPVAAGRSPLLDPGWVRPWWLERQVDPDSPDVSPGVATDPSTAGAGRPGLPANVTHRDWVLLGNLAAWARAAVDPRGLVTPWDGAWSVDWWIGAEDRWHVPSRSIGVRQRLLGASPVVETAMRVPGGDAVHRAFAVHTGPGSPGFAVIEIENRTAVPFAVALSVRPVNPVGAVAVHRIGVEGATVLVDGVPGLLFAKAPARLAGSTGAAGDVASVVFAGDAGTALPADLHCPDGAATAAFVFPLPHTAVLRAVLPLTPPVPASSARAGRRGTGTLVAFPDAVPSAEQVADGWEAQTRRAIRLNLPDPLLAEAVESARRHLLVVHAGEDLVSWPEQPLDHTEAATILLALGHQGFTAEAAEVLTTWPERQTLDGTMVGAPGRMDAAGGALAAVGEHWALTHDAALPESLVGPVAKAIHWIDKRRSGRVPGRLGVGRRGGPPALPGLLPEGPGPAWAASRPAPLADAAWSWRGLTAAAAMLDATGQPEVAEDARRFATALADELRTALGPAGAAATGASAVDDVARLLCVAPHGPLPADDPRATAILDRIRAVATAPGTDGRAVVQWADGAGLSPVLTALLALAEVEAGDRRALDRLTWLVDAAGETGRWPTVLHPRSGGGSSGQGSDAHAVALFLEVVRRLLVREVPDGLALCSVVPDRWLGQPFDARDLPTAFGTFGFAVRWHGDRPALLWELEPHDGVTDLVVTAPGLDPSWEGRGLVGEALLGPVAVPASMAEPVVGLDVAAPDAPDDDAGVAVAAPFRPIPTGTPGPPGSAIPGTAAPGSAARGAGAAGGDVPDAGDDGAAGGHHDGGSFT